MTLKVNLPNPNELSVEQFFAQLRISIKAAEKTYQEATKGLTEEEVKDNFWIFYEFSPEIEEALNKIDPDREQRLNIALTINKL